MYPNDMDFDMLTEQVRQLAQQMQDVIAEVARIRNMPDLTARLDDLERRIQLIESAPDETARAAAIGAADAYRDAMRQESLRSMLD